MPKDPLALFHAPTERWFRASLGEPTPAQALAFPPIAEGRSTLLLAPTGSGKTLAAFLTALDRLMWTPAPAKDVRCRVLYVSPLKALAVDIERNLRAPLAGIAREAAQEGLEIVVPQALVRTGDTPPSERAKMLRTPPDILITTPESLFLLLTSNASKTLASVETVIIDEIHSLVPSKRGAHLFLSIERLERLRPPGSPPLQRVGLSATQRPLDEVARLLGGVVDGRSRPIEILDAGLKRRLEVTVEVPAIDMARLGEQEDVPIGAASSGGSRRSIWPYLHERIVPLVRQHRSTLIFVNSRRLAERLAAALNEVAGEEIALAHHGSVAREKRMQIEERLKQGELPAVVATSSLELGIDMGAIDLVIQVEAPPSVASGLQRIGRAGHTVGGISRGIIFPKHRGDLLPCAVATQRMRAGEVEATYYPKNPLDVLAQQIVAIVAETQIGVDELYALVRQAAPFAELPRGAYEGVLDMLSGRYPSDDFTELRPRVTWDRTKGVLKGREGAKRLAIVNGGTIPDRGLYGVFLAGGGDEKRARRVGELDEEMVFELREGEIFLLGASSWRAEQITHDRVIVSPAAGEPGKMPFWRGDRPGRPLEFGQAIGALARTLSRSDATKAGMLLAKDHGLEPNAARNLLGYLGEQIEATGELPTDRTLVVERFKDELGDWRICVLSLFGARVHAPWATVIVDRLREERLGDVETVWSDDGMAFRIPASSEPPPVEWFLPEADTVEGRITRSLGHTSLFAAHFRECAARALLLPRKRPGERTPLWAQRKRSADLLAVAARHPSFPILLETYRECMRDVFDLPGLVQILKSVSTREIRVVTVDTRSPSPFSASLLFSFVANFIYDGDAPLAERRAQALSIDHVQLRELLGEAELRSLLDPDATFELERDLQRLTHPVRHADALHDMLLSLGDLSPEEVRARSDASAPGDGWLKELAAARRIAEVRIAGELRWVAAEDMGKLRDALGVVPPRGTPEAFLGAPEDPLGDLVARFARKRGPFVAADVAARFGTGIRTTEQALSRLEARGKMETGEFLPEPRGAKEYCDVEVLRTLRRKSLAKLRRAVEPVDGAAYARLLVDWQIPPRRGPEGLLEAIRQLEGCPLPASALEREILAARVEGFQTWDLDALCASGEVVWAGLGPLGAADGRVALFLADHEALLTPPAFEAPGELAARIRALLQRRGAVFFAEIARELGGFSGDVTGALWDLVWAGEVTNDTLEPLRSLLRAKGTRAVKGRRPPSRGGPRGAPGTEGRWSLRASRWAERPTETERRAALARALLERYGVVTREVAQAEAIGGGFSAVYEVYKTMEESGRIRRGYFVAGRGATQFALPGADDRLRAMREPQETPHVRILAATDPANPYGALLPWPDAPASKEDSSSDAARRPQRAAGAMVILDDGALVGWLARNGQTLLTFLPTDSPARERSEESLCAGLASLVETGRRKVLLLSSIDGVDAGASLLGKALAQAGFTAGARGWMRRRASVDRSGVIALRAAR